MFCINCGEKLINDAKFCPYCGVDVAAGIKRGQAVEVLHEAVSGADAAKKTDEKMMEEIFTGIFNTRCEFGKDVYVFGKDEVFPEMEYAVKDYYLSEDPLEKPLLVFDYSRSGFVEKGIVITNQRVIWEYGERMCGDIFLKDIKSITMGKAGLANVMKITSWGEVVYKDIFLTWMEHEEKFVMKFKKFIHVMQEQFGITENDDKDDRMPAKKMDGNLASHFLEGIKWNSAYCEAGNPVVPQSSKKYQRAKLYFGIPEEDEIFLIYDSTVFGNCKKGFALCTSGFYYCLSNSGNISWDKFALVKISKCISGLQIDKKEFTVETGVRNNLLTVLERIQNYLD